VQKDITPNLWFDGNAKEAVDFYVSVFPDSKIVSTEYYPEEGLADFQKELAGKELAVEFELSGNRFVAINAGPEFKFNESVSFSIPC
jgi:predicted 3-demethylubiquinone-9 3-methyltransferase (glyoxalase superfamily)